MNERDQWLVSVTAGTWQTNGIREAQKAGFKVLAIDSDAEAEGFKYAEKKLITGFDDFGAILKLLEKESINITGAVSFCSEAGMQLAARIREHFNLPGADSSLCARLQDKGIQRKVWSEKGVPGPEWVVCINTDEAKQARYGIDYPYIVKPTDSSGSRGVTKIESPHDDFDLAVERAFRFSRSGRIIIEAFMEGTEFTVETITVSGVTDVLAVTEKKKVEGTKGTVAYELATSERSAAIIDKIKSAIIDALGALGYSDGPGHSEVILMHNGDVGVVEVAGRGGGFMVFDRFVPMTSGVNIARLTALQAAGVEIERPMINERAGVLRFFPSTEGMVSRITGIDKANLLEGVYAESFVKVGDSFDRAIADGDRLGCILVNADTPENAQNLANRAEQLIHFEMQEV